jgi:Fic family protein
MSYEPHFTISRKLLGTVERIAALREQIQHAAVDVAWIPALQKDMRTRTAHASTAIEGNPLTLAEVRGLVDGPPPTTAVPRSRQEVLNYLAGLRYVEKHAEDTPILDANVCELHRILAKGVMDQGAEGEYRFIEVSVGPYTPPLAREVPGLMAELLGWWNARSEELSPVLSSAILHYRFEAIHPFGDGNGRAGRALALWELYRRGFDTNHIFSVDEYFWENRLAYYAALTQVREADEDLSGWLEYCAAGVHQTLERVWDRIQTVQPEGAEPLVLRPRQEHLLQLLRDTGSMSPPEIWEALGVSRQGAMDLIRPLMEAGVLEKIGTKKTGRYQLKRR